MKKSLRQMLTVTLSAVLLAGASTSFVAAQEESSASEETSSVVSENAPEESTAEESGAEEVPAEEMSEAQTGLDEALALFETEYPESSIAKINVERSVDDETEEVSFEYDIEGLDAELNEYELDLVYANGEVVESEFSEGWLNNDDEDQEGAESVSVDENQEPPLESDEASTEEATTEEASTEAEEVASDAESVQESAESTEESAEETAEFEERALDLEQTITLDEATEIALTEAGSGEVVEWTLESDTAEFWGLFGDEANENPIWVMDVEDMEADNDTEVHVDAITGEVLNLDEVQEDAAGAQNEAAEESAESTEEAVEESAESTEEAAEESAESTEEAAEESAESTEEAAEESADAVESDAEEAVESAESETEAN